MRLQENNNNSERFFKFMPLVSVSFHQSCTGFDGMHPNDNASTCISYATELDDIPVACKTTGKSSKSSGKIIDI